MTSIPPLLPEETLLRVMRLARFDGMGVLIVAAVFSVLSAMAGDRSGAIIGLLIAGAGAIELHGTGLLRHGDARGMNWLVTSQLFLLVTILAYCQFQLMSADLTILKSLLTNEQKAQITALGMSVDQYIQTLKRISVILIAIATTLYQGGMTIYYLRRRKAVERALAS